MVFNPSERNMHLMGILGHTEIFTLNRIVQEIILKILHVGR
jgi:hypothetical protein